MYVNFSSSCGNWHTIFPFLSSSSFPANAANRYLGTKQYLPTALLYRLQKSGKICMAGQGHGLFPPLLRYSVGLHPITLRNTAVK